MQTLVIAGSELPSVVAEIARLSRQHPDTSAELNDVLTRARAAHQKALDDYLSHVETHGCGIAAEAQRPTDGKR